MTMKIKNNTKNTVVAYYRSYTVYDDNSMSTHGL